MSTEVNRANCGEGNAFCVCRPILVVQAVFLHNAVGTKLCCNRDFAICRLRHICGSDRLDRCIGINIAHIVTRNFRIVTGFVLSTEVNRANCGEGNAFRVHSPVLVVQTVFLHNAVGTELGCNDDFAIRRLRHICRCNRSNRIDLINIYNLPGHFGHITGIIGHLEINSSGVGNQDGCTCMPNFLVIAVLNRLDPADAIGCTQGECYIPIRDGIRVAGDHQDRFFRIDKHNSCRLDRNIPRIISDSEIDGSIPVNRNSGTALPRLIVGGIFYRLDSAFCISSRCRNHNRLVGPAFGITVDHKFRISRISDRKCFHTAPCADISEVVNSTDFPVVVSISDIRHRQHCSSCLATESGGPEVAISRNDIFIFLHTAQSIARHIPGQRNRIGTGCRLQTGRSCRDGIIHHNRGGFTPHTDIVVLIRCKYPEIVGTVSKITDLTGRSTCCERPGDGTEICICCILDTVFLDTHTGIHRSTPGQHNRSVGCRCLHIFRHSWCCCIHNIRSRRRRDPTSNVTGFIHSADTEIVFAIRETGYIGRGAGRSLCLHHMSKRFIRCSFDPVFPDSAVVIACSVPNQTDTAIILRIDRHLRGSPRGFRIDIIHLVAGDFRPVPNGILGTEVDRANFREGDTFRVRRPVFVVQTVFFYNAIGTECGANGNFTVRGSSDICRSYRGNRCIRVDVINCVAHDFRVIPRFVLTTEINRTHFREGNAFRVRRPVLVIQTVFLHDGVFAEGGADSNFAIGRLRHVCCSNRLDRCIGINVADSVTRNFGIVTGFVLTTEIDRTNYGEDHTGFIGLPVFVVQTVFLHNAVGTELGCNRNFTVRGFRHIRRSNRLDRDFGVNIANIVARNFGIVTGFVLSTEVDRADFREGNAFCVRRPVFVVQTVFLHDAVGTECGADGNFAIGRLRHVCCSNRGNRCIRVDVINCVARNFGVVSGFVLTSEVNSTHFREGDAFRVCRPVFVVKAVLSHDGIFAKGGTDGDLAIRGSSDICRRNRLDRDFGVNVADSIAHNFRIVTRFVLTTKIDRTNCGEGHTGFIGLPVFIVQTVFLHNAVGTELCCNRDFAICRLRHICCGNRGNRCIRINVADSVARNFRIVPRFVLSTEVDSADFREGDAFRVCGPVFVVQTVFLHNAVGTELCCNRDFAVRRLRHVRCSNRGNRCIGINVRNFKRRIFTFVFGLRIYGFEIVPAVRRCRVRTIELLPVLQVGRTVCLHTFRCVRRYDDLL